MGYSRRSQSSSSSAITPASSQSGATTTGANPSAPVDQTHGAVGVDGAFNAPEVEFGTAVADDDRIKVLHSVDNKLNQPAGAVPAPEDLYERSTFFGNLWGTFHTDPAFKPVTSIEGTPALPAVSYDHPVESALYIGGAPHIEDIHQGDLADCYFLASVGAVVASDPGQIQGAITGSATGASVTLYRKDDTGSVVPVNLNVTNDLRVEDLGDGATGGTPLGAGVRAAETAHHAEYYASIDDTTLRVYADRYWEMAMWAPLLEKAYAQYAGQYGQYGGFQAEEKARPGEDGAPASDYGYLNGGVAQVSYQILYGPDAQTVDELSWDTGADAATTLGANVGIVQNLLWASGVGVPAGTDMHMTVGASRDVMVERLDRMSEALLARADIATHADLQADVTVLRTHITAWRSADEADKAARLQDVAAAAADIVDRVDHPELYDGASPTEYKNYAENANIVALIATDQSTGQRHTYAWHSYTVLGSSFKKADGTDVPGLTPSTAPALVNLIDPVQSTVRLRNPHGQNSPNLEGAPAEDNGEFTLTLDSFTRSFSFQQFGVVNT